MGFDPQAIFANLAEKEKIKGHHSPEGQAIRTLSRAVNGWSSGNLSELDVLALCDQSVEDWLKTRLRLSAWSAPSFPELLEKAVATAWITRTEAARLQRMRNARRRDAGEESPVAPDEVKTALEFCIQLVEKYW